MHFDTDDGVLVIRPRAPAAKAGAPVRRGWILALVAGLLTIAVVTVLVLAPQQFRWPLVGLSGGLILGPTVLALLIGRGLGRGTDYTWRFDPISRRVTCSGAASRPIDRPLDRLEQIEARSEHSAAHGGWVYLVTAHFGTSSVDLWHTPTQDAARAQARHIQRWVDRHLST